MKTRSTDWRLEYEALHEELDTIQRMTLSRIITGIRREKRGMWSDGLLLLAAFLCICIGFVVGISI